MENNSRRQFMQQAATLAAGAVLLPQFPFGTPEKPLGIQLWSVRDVIKDDLSGTLKALSRIGFNYLEGYGLEKGKILGSSIGDFKKAMKEYELKMSSIHVRFESKHYDSAKKDLTDEWKKNVEDALKLGNRYIISPWTADADRKSPDTYKEFCDLLNKCGDYCKTQNIRFGYHNHAFEFTTKWDDKAMYDILLENTNPEVVTMQLDWMWAVRGGRNVAEMYAKNPGRFELAHIKDLAEEGKDESTIIGNGVIDFEAILPVAKKNGLKMYVMELEHYAKSPLDDLKVCYNNFRDIMDNVEAGKNKKKKK